MDHTFYTLLIFNILIYSTKPQSINKDTSLGVTPNWFGSFYTTAECDVGKCCCIYGLLTLSKIKPNYLRIVGQLEGYNCPVNRQIDSTINMPTGFKTQFFLLGGLVDITLSDDSRVIKLYNQNAPACSGGAVKNHARSITPINQMKMVLMIITIFLGKNLLHLY